MLCLFFILAAMASGCGTGSGKFEGPYTLSGTLAWDTPTAYNDGTELPQTDIKEYRLYYRAETDSYSATRYFVIAAPATSVDLKSLNIPYSPAERYHFVITTVDSAGVESGFSNEVALN